MICCKRKQLSFYGNPKENDGMLVGVLRDFCCATFGVSFVRATTQRRRLPTRAHEHNSSLATFLEGNATIVVHALSYNTLIKRNPVHMFTLAGDAALLHSPLASLLQVRAHSRLLSQLSPSPVPLLTPRPLFLLSLLFPPHPCAPLALPFSLKLAFSSFLRGLSPSPSPPLPRTPKWLSRRRLAFCSRGGT